MQPIRRACIKPHTAIPDLGRLGLGERLVANALRRWIMGLHQNEAWHWSIAWDALAAELGPASAREALRALDVLVRELAAGARRRVRYHHPCCPLLTADEAAILCLAAACQAGAHTHRDALVRWLVQPPGFERLAAAAEDLAAALAAAGMRLAMPEAPGWGGGLRQHGATEPLRAPRRCAVGSCSPDN